jgi:sulfur-oxidizing protein SoxZ
MAKSSIKVRAKSKGGLTTVKALITHPMETGLRKNKKTGKMYPAHFIQDVTCTIAGKSVFTANMSGGVSKNPYISFKVNGANKGDEIVLSWQDNQGGSDTSTSAIR